VPGKTLCDMIMLKCNKHVFFGAISRGLQKQCQTLLVITILTFFAQRYFLITNMRVATEEFFSVTILAVA